MMLVPRDVMPLWNQLSCRGRGGRGEKREVAKGREGRRLEAGGSRRGEDGVQ